jgi:hypothetical protein
LGNGGSFLGDFCPGNSHRSARSLALSMKSLSLPPKDDDDDGEPLRVEHRVDYMFAEPGKLEFMYNYILYTWTFGAVTITARTYLDDLQNVSVFGVAADASVFTEPDDLEAAPYLPALRYLQRRFSVIKVSTRGGSYRVMQNK